MLEQFTYVDLLSHVVKCIVIIVCRTNLYIRRKNDCTSTSENKVYTIFGAMTMLPERTSITWLTIDYI